MIKTLKKITTSKLFNNFILSVILGAGVLVGMETYPGIVAKHHAILSVLDKVILWIFIVEAALKIAAEGRNPLNYFKDGWNIFDFSIVVVCFLPINASYIAVLRLARILRVFRIVTTMPKLQILVGALIKSIPSMGYVFILLLIHFYIFGVMGTFLFTENDPVHFGDLQTSMLSLFRVVTLEDWTDIMYINMYGCDQYGYVGSRLPCTNANAMPLTASLYFVFFVLTGAMIVLNLFIGVIMNGMNEMQQELADKKIKNAGMHIELFDELHRLQRTASEMNEQLSQIKKKYIEAEKKKGIKKNSG